MANTIMEQNKPVQAAAAPEATFKPRMSEERINKAIHTLQRYKAGKERLEKRLIASEQWWKMRHWEWMESQGNPNDPRVPSAWLFNTIISKHADGIQSYPQPNILPREEGDKQTAKVLSDIVPCVLEQNDFEETYSDVLWQKLKQGTGIYGIFWDATKLNGLGDISIRKVDALNLFWEPGITDIQKSENVFHVELIDNERLEQIYPQLKGKLTVAKSCCNIVSLWAILCFMPARTTPSSPWPCRKCPAVLIRQPACPQRCSSRCLLALLWQKPAGMHTANIPLCLTACSLLKAHPAALAMWTYASTPRSRLTC